MKESMRKNAKREWKERKIEKKEIEFKETWKKKNIFL